MEGFDFDAGPAEFQRVRSLSQAMFFLAGLSFIINYFLAIRTAFRHNAAGIPLASLGCNISWEVTYALFYCPPDWVSQVILRVWLFINIFVLYAMVKNTGKAQSNSVFSPRYVPLFTTFYIVFFLSAHYTFAAHLGDVKALYWGGMASQVFMNASALSGLIQRGNTRGCTYGMWLSEFMGLAFTLIGVYMRAWSWPEKWGWSSGILMAWFATWSIILNIAYAVCFWLTRRAEGVRQPSKQE